MRVLIADDDASFRTVLERQLSKWGYEVVVAADGAEAWRHLDGEDPPRLVLLDWMMPGLQGVEACRRLRGKPDGAYYYIVLLTAKGGSENMIEGINAGADDYVVKPFDEQELRVRLRAGRRIVELQEALQREASTDSLTGLRNRTAIYSILKRELQREAGVAARAEDDDPSRRGNGGHRPLQTAQRHSRPPGRRRVPPGSRVPAPFFSANLRFDRAVGRGGVSDRPSRLLRRHRHGHRGARAHFDRRHTAEGQGHYRHGHNQRRGRLLGRRAGSRSGHTDSCGRPGPLPRKGRWPESSPRRRSRERLTFGHEVAGSIRVRSTFRIS